MTYRAQFHGMTVEQMAQYGATLPADKDGILSAGRPIKMHNAHIAMSRMARLVAYCADAAARAAAGDCGCEGEGCDCATLARATLDNARIALASAEGEVYEGEHAWQYTPEGETMAILSRDARGNAHPRPWGDDSVDVTNDARQARARRAREGATVGASPAGDVVATEMADVAAARAFPPCTCDAPRAKGETWRAFLARRNGCEGCAARRAHPSYGIRPALAPETSPAWEGMQGDRVAARGRAPAVGSAGIGARRMGRGTL